MLDPLIYHTRPHGPVAEMGQVVSVAVTRDTLAPVTGSRGQCYTMGPARLLRGLGVTLSLCLDLHPA